MTASIEPLRLGFEVNCSVEHAFDTWTTRTSLWWPVTHTTDGTPGYEITIEPFVGGRVFERSPNGLETDWGQVTAWDPPQSLSYLWHIMTSRERATDVNIRFLPAGGGATRVEITHTGWERLGADGQPWRDRNQAGWNSLLPHFIAACNRESNPDQ